MRTRRQLVLAIGAVALTAPLTAFSQQPGKVWRIGILSARQSRDADNPYSAFLKGLNDLGYFEGKNFVTEARYAEGKFERLPGLAAELVQAKVDVIVASGTPGARAAQKATARIPIVMIGVADPVGSGLVRSLARPDGNITGLSTLSPNLSQKHLELLLTLEPRPARVAVLVDPSNLGQIAILRSVQLAAAREGPQIVPAEARNVEQIVAAFAVITREKAAALIHAGGLFNLHQRHIAELAVKHRLPSIATARQYADAGGLMSYGQDIRERYHRAAAYVDKILKGAKPAELPIEQPTKFELVVNMKTAKALGITIPSEILLRANRVIE